MKFRLTPCLVWLLVASASFGQTFYGSIVGSVTMPPPALFPKRTSHLSISALPTAGAANELGKLSVRQSRSRPIQDRDGEDRISPFLREPITVEVQSTVRIDVGMQVGDVNQIIEVTAQTPLLQTENASLGQVVESRKVLEMPLNGRNIFGLVALVPGVVPGGQSGTTPTGTNPFAWGNYQIGGGQSNQSAAYIDGASVNVSYVI